MPDSAADTPGLPGPRETEAPWDATSELASYVVNRLLSLGLSLAKAGGTDGNDLGSDEIAAATGEVFQLIHDIGAVASASASQQATELRDRVARAARQLQATTLDTAALLERRADLVRRPSRTDYPAEIKVWRAYADQAGQIAERFEQQP